MDIAGQICEAIDQIVNERLKSINYDTTIIATIIDNKEAKNNKYTCSNGTSSFIAYSYRALSAIPAGGRKVSVR